MPQARVSRVWAISCNTDFSPRSLQYKAIMRLNDKKSTGIRVGEWLIVKPLPAECRAVNPYAR